MITLDGVALSPGVARGPALIFRPTQGPPPGAEDTGDPLEQFRAARSSAEEELRDLLAALPEAQRAACGILRAHLALIEDPLLVSDVETRITRTGVAAREALAQAAATLSSRFEALADPRMRQRAADVRDVCECVGRHLDGVSAAATNASECSVVCAADLSPAQVLQLARARPLGFVLEQGTDSSHAAILMCALGIPVIIRLPGATAVVRDGDLVVVDGTRGQVFVRPESSLPLTDVTPATVCDADPDPHVAITRDGRTIAVTATIADADEASSAMAAGADGIGLLRTEVLFLRNAHAPSEDEQASCYAQIAGIVGRRALTIRLLDLGADKQSPAIQWRAEPNPALGLRGVRLLFAQPELLRTQLRAVFRAAAGQRVRLLVPMVVDAADVERVRELTADAAGRDAAFDIGAMVETPAAALMAEELASAADFLSIGTNDLVQYVLAADREAAHMAAFYQVMHPAVLRLIDGVMAAAARHARPVSVCGEAAADPRAIPLFLGLGVTELSVLPSRVPRVKAQVREVSIAVARRLAEEVAGLPTAAAVAARLQAAVVETTRDVRETGHAR